MGLDDPSLERSCEIITEVINNVRSMNETIKKLLTKYLLRVVLGKHFYNKLRTNKKTI